MSQDESYLHHSFLKRDLPANEEQQEMLDVLQRCLCLVVTVSWLTETLTEYIFPLGRTCSVSVLSKRHKAAESSPSDEDRCHPLCGVS